MKLLVTSMVFFFCLGSFYAQKQILKPNVIIINADDLGYGDVGAYGAIKVNTPAMDTLAAQGIRLTDFHAASAVCSPSRYALMTGRYPHRKNLYSPIFLRTKLQVDTNRTTIADVMKRAGYATAIIGKWHLGFGDQEPVDWNKPLKPGPLELGFDYYFGVPVLNSHPPFVYVENHDVVGLLPDKDPFVYGEEAYTRYFDEKFDMDQIGGAKKAHDMYKDREVGTTFKNKAVDWIKQHKDSPFFLYLATTNIHHPFTPSPQFIGTSKAGAYGDFIHELDWIISEIMSTLEEEQIEGNTLLIVTSDNGGMLNRGGQIAREAGHHQNGELLGFKFDAWEGGHRVPFIARWPGHIEPGSTSDALASNVDLLATLAAVTTQRLSKDEGPDSINILDILTGKTSTGSRHDLLISPRNPSHITLRSGEWVYKSNQGGGGFVATELGSHEFGGPAAFPFTGQVNSDIEKGRIKDNAPSGQLYNIVSDKGQHSNLYNDQPEVVREMKTKMSAILSEE
ncbi:sulfatase family protein [Allomuricauda sp. CP2A]|uniref:sulfatase family protein n=1 Tax=Allomuricauda sp. CP2A TaxID=1848189 RepID=UPI001C4012F8|nr:arylsulfatase [Muricauda sp. CP2A]